jgi:demethylmenaquinone methyltransferase/2-methoxy-6-polyprenyl-1,4-benzoquinol methylase
VTVSTSKEPARIAGMFDAIARRYDTLNRVLSAGLDRRWRRRAVSELGLAGSERVLDVCTGTADLAIEAARTAGGAAQVVGVDFAGAMLEIGLGKVRRAHLAGRVHLVRGDAVRLPIADGAFDAAMVAFGLRNVADLAGACRELRRALRPGGRLAILEFGLPRVPGLAALYTSYFRHILPRIGRLVSRHDDAYRYLPASVAEFPSDQAFAGVLREAGFSAVRVVRLSLGAVYLYLAARD